jgi:hypothetical protein
MRTRTQTAPPSPPRLANGDTRVLAAACNALNDVVCAGSAFDRAALVAPLAAVLCTHASAHPPAVAATSAAALSALLWQAPRLERRALNDAATAAGAPGAAAAALTAFGVADADVALGAASLLANMCVSHELGTGAGDAAVTAGALEAVTAALAANARNQAAAPLICALANLLPAACNAALRARACAAGAAAAVAAVAAAQPLMPGLDHARSALAGRAVSARALRSERIMQPDAELGDVAREVAQGEALALVACSRVGCMEHSAALKLCAGCKVVRYCSEACQKLDWKAHKAGCKRITAAKLKGL